MNEPGTLCWNELATRDADGAQTFYPAVFGWGMNHVDMGGGMTYTEWKVGERGVAGMMAIDENWPAEIPNHWMVYFAVADCDASAELVTSLGGSIRMPPMDIPEVGRFAVCADPQGAVFSIMALAEARVEAGS